MLTRNSYEVVVIGGAAGAVIASALKEKDVDVALLFREDTRGATYTNQKWLHSGLLYPSHSCSG